MKKTAIALIAALCLSQHAALAVTLDEAKEIALAHAGAPIESVTFVEVKRDADDGRGTYDVEFVWDAALYDYEIDAQSGEILSFEGGLGGAQAAGSELTAEEALAIALAQAGLEPGDVQVIKTEDEFEGGRRVYEIEFRAGRVEYECTVDAATGRIVEWDKD